MIEGNLSRCLETNPVTSDGKASRNERGKFRDEVEFQCSMIGALTIRFEWLMSVWVVCGASLAKFSAHVDTFNKIEPRFESGFGIDARD